MSDHDERYLTAIHEAGHAVVGQALGLTVHEVTVRGGPGGGICVFDPEPHDTLEAIERELSQVLAGRLAVALERGEDWRRSLRDPLSPGAGLSLFSTIELESSSLDGLRGTGMRYRDYVKAAEGLLGDSRAGYPWMAQAVPAAAEEAVRILEERWVDVQSLAIRLNAKGVVDLGEKARHAKLLEDIERLEVRVARDRRLAASR